MLTTSWLPAAPPMPETFSALIQQFCPDASPHAAQLLWQRQMRQPQQLADFLDARQYQPTGLDNSLDNRLGSASLQAIARLQQAQATSEKLLVWGDAASVATTALLQQGLSQIFDASQLTYQVSRSLTAADLEAFVAAGCSLLMGCGPRDLGKEAAAAGMSVIWIDQSWPTGDLAGHPAVAAWFNSRSLSAEHPLANLPSVALAYKLMEAVYPALEVNAQVTDLLDLIAIGLLADPVPLTGESRYLAQLGIAQLQRNQDPLKPPRPGIAKLLQLCRITGDRPTEISMGLGRRIQAISRLWDDPNRAVELLISQESNRCSQLAEQVELANARRKVLQRQVVAQAQAKLAELDLSTTHVILLSDPQWPAEILGLAAGQLAQAHGRPVILLSQSEPEAIGSARMNGSELSSGDLCQLLQTQASWLSQFWGEGAAAELRLPSQNIAPFAEAINQQARVMGITVQSPRADLTVTVAELGKALFQELRLLEPFGIGNPTPLLLIRNGWLTQTWHRKIRDLSGQKLDYIKTEFELWDETTDQGFPGVWWGHYKDELPIGRCDLLVELDFSSYEDAKRQKRYEVRLIAVRLATDDRTVESAEILDRRGELISAAAGQLAITRCPKSWQELAGWLQQAQQTSQTLVLAYDLPALPPPLTLWQALVERSDSLREPVSEIALRQLQAELNLSEQTLKIGLAALPGLDSEQFISAVAQEQFMQRYFAQVPLKTLQAATLAASRSSA